MFIEAVKIGLQESEVSTLWRFRNDQGTHRNICVIHGNEEDQQLLVGALRWALGGAKDPKIKSSLVQFTDNGGDSWIIDRNGEAYRFFRNRQLIDGTAELLLRNIFKEQLTVETSSPLVLTDILREFDLVFDGSSLQAAFRHSGKVRKSPLEQQGLARLDELKESLQSLLGGSETLTEAQLEHLLMHGASLVRKQESLLNQAKDIGTFSAHLSHMELGLSMRLEQELVLLDRIRQHTEPLIDPARSPKILRDRLQKLDNDLLALQVEGLEAKDFPMPDAEIDWPQVLQCLTRYLACDRLEKFARKSVHEARSQIKPAYDEYRISVGQFLQIDRDLIQELEKCLSDLGEQARRSEEDEGKNRDGITGKLNRLLGWPSKGADGTAGASPSPAEHLDQSRAAVNLCLQQLGKLYGDLERHAEVHDDKLAQLDERYEKVVLEFGKARDQWLEISRKYQLPNGLGIRGIVNYINNYNSINLLQQKRARTQEELQSIRQEIRALSKLLEDWRTHTGSQKSVKLENSSMILSEARGVLQYAAKKKNQLQKVKTIESKQDAFRQLRDSLDQEMGKVSTRWTKLLQNLNLPDRSLPLEDWTKILAIGIESLALRRLLLGGIKLIKNEHIFSGETLDFPINLYIWKPGTQGNKARIALLQQLEISDDGGLALILTDDQASVEILLKIGLSQGIKAQAKPSALVDRAQKPVKTVVSDKARAALDIFSGKNLDGSRKNL